jgi:UDP-3-O-[3-hydroxymyristoyl] glucosamine N-acyltransferase
MSSSLTLQQLANLVGGEIRRGDPDTVLTGINSITEAARGEVTFLGNDRYVPALKTTQASAVLVAGHLEAASASGPALVAVDNPTLAFSAVVRHFTPAPLPFRAGIHPSAQVAEGARLDPARVCIGPCVVIEAEAEIGDGCSIHASAYVGRGARLGEGCVLHAGSIVRERCVLGRRVIVHSGTVIGSDGFGYEFTGGRHVKIEQVGIVEIGDDVEIGACTTIDRARFGRTLIGEGTKIDNLVQIGHNVRIGRHCVIVSQVGISGSTRLGDHVTVAGQVGIAGHLEIADRVVLLAKSGVTKSLTDPGAYTGFPARPLLEGRRLLTLPGKIPDILHRLKVVEKRLAELEATAGQAS